MVEICERCFKSNASCGCDHIAPKAIMVNRRAVHCAATRCGCVVDQGQAMCREHWNMLPHAMRTAIVRPYLARQMELYQAEFHKAVEYIERKEGRYKDIFGKAVA